MAQKWPLGRPALIWSVDGLRSELCLAGRAEPSRAAVLGRGGAGRRAAAGFVRGMAQRLTMAAGSLQGLLPWSSLARCTPRASSRHCSLANKC